MQRMLSKVFGSTNDRELKRLAPIVARINELDGGRSRAQVVNIIAQSAEYTAMTNPILKL